MVRVFVADDHDLLRAGVRAVLAEGPELRVVGEARSGNAALAAILELKPDLAVLDLHMPEIGGVELARKLRDRGAPVRVIILSVHGEPDDVREALAAGAFGYVVKGAVGEQLLSAVRAVARGEVYLSPQLIGPALLAGRAGRAGGPCKPELTPRERDVVRLLSDGLSSKQIADQLELTAKTVDGYRSTIMAKLGVHSVAGLVRYALKHHLAPLEP